MNQAQRSTRKNVSRRAQALIAVAAFSSLPAANALAQTLNLPPINGFQPLVIFGMTDEQWGGDDFTDLNSYFSQASSTPGANGKPSNNLPIGGDQKFFVAIIDTGAQASILSFDTAEQVNLGTANRVGNYSLQIIGASGSEIADITDPVGIYMTDLNRGQPVGPDLSILPNTTLKGMWNASVLTTQPESVLPNIIGSPVVGLYQVIIKNSEPTHVTVGGTTYKSPKVDFAPINTATPSNYGKVALTTTNNVGGPPAFTPSFDDFGNIADNPAVPSIWESIFASISATHTGIDEITRNSTNSFMFDTGAQVSVLSSDTAANVGIYTAGENPTPPDFFTEILGVGGQITEVPGYYINAMSMVSTGGPLNFTNVPVIVLDLPDPRNINQTLPGIIGTNLFTARDIIINIDSQGTGMTGLYVSPAWAWKFNGSGNWSDASKWNVVLPNGIDTQANFFGAITNPHTVTVDGAGFTVGSIAFDNSKHYTLGGTGTITLDVSVAQAQINVNKGSHTINAAMTFADDTQINVLPAGSVLTINGAVAATGVNVIKDGQGVAEMKNIRAASLNITGGTFATLANGTSAGTSKLSTLSISNGGRWDLKDNNLVITGMAREDVEELVVSGFGNFDWQGTGIMSSHAAAQAQIGAGTALGVLDNAEWGHEDIDGFAVGPNDIIVKYTFNGDANLDGAVNNDDFGLFLLGFNGANPQWFFGDFDYSGFVNNDDFVFFLAGLFAFQDAGNTPLSAEFHSQLADFATAQGVPLLVPEPSALATFR